MPTPKQEKFIKLLLENIGKTGESKTLGELLLEAGYSEAISKNPYLILESDGVKAELEPYLKRVEKERDRVIRAMEKKDLDQVSYDKLAEVVDKLTKNIQLLSGAPTEKHAINVQISEAVAKRYDLTPNSEPSSGGQAPI